MTVVPDAVTDRWAISFAGQTYATWSRAELVRDLSEISGSFRLELRDAARHASFPFADLMDARALVEAGLEAQLTIDGQAELIGWVDEINPQCRGGQVSVTVSGRDKTADLIDCAATVTGPWEYRGQKLDQIAKSILAPYGLEVRADVDVGDAFDRFVIEVGETAMSAIEKGARQRQVLLVSDGLGALVLTRSGKQRGPADLVFPGGNVSESAGWSSMRERYSAYHVVAQAERAGGRRRNSAKLDVTAEPLGTGGTASAAAAEHELGGVNIAATAKDEEVTRHRPFVAMARTQLTAKAAQDQADWMARVSRAASLKVEHLVRGYGDGRPWRPNELVAVRDSFQNVNRDLIVAGLSKEFGDWGAVTRLRLTGPEAFDMEPVSNRAKNHQQPKTLDTTARAL